MLLVAWAIFSIIVVAAAVGFAGSIENVFVSPLRGDILSIAVWLFSWILVVAPFVLLLIHFAWKSMK
jgi:hypothetical protein